MDTSHERAIRQSAGLAYVVARIERALAVCEALDALHLLPGEIRAQLAAAEEIAPDTLARTRALLSGKE